MPALSAERARIMDAAYRTLVANEGVTLSMTELLTTARLGTRAFYRHFASKDELLLALFRRDAGRLGERLAAVATGPPLTALAAFAEAVVRPRSRHRLMSAEAIRRAAGYSAESRRFHTETADRLAGILARGRADGSFPLADPRPDARWIHAALARAFEEQTSGNAPVPAVEAARQVIDFALRALGVPNRAAGPRTPAE